MAKWEVVHENLHRADLGAFVLEVLREYRVDPLEPEATWMAVVVAGDRRVARFREHPSVESAKAAAVRALRRICGDALAACNRLEGIEP